MRVEKDYKELLKLFNKHKVKYCIVGAFAVGFHAIPRYSKDMDILVEPSSKNSQEIVKALSEFGFSSLGLSEDDFTQKNRIIQLGYEPVRRDLLTSIKGCTFDKIWKNKVVGEYGNIKVFFIGREELIKSKKKSARISDKFDLKILLSQKTN